MLLKGAENFFKEVKWFIEEGRTAILLPATLRVVRADSLKIEEGMVVRR